VDGEWEWALRGGEMRKTEQIIEMTEHGNEKGMAEQEWWQNTG
jgi:hypothetical protein